MVFVTSSDPAQTPQVWPPKSVWHGYTLVLSSDNQPSISIMESLSTRLSQTFPRVCITCLARNPSRTCLGLVGEWQAGSGDTGPATCCYTSQVGLLFLIDHLVHFTLGLSPLVHFLEVPCLVWGCQIGHPQHEAWGLLQSHTSSGHLTLKSYSRAPHPTLRALFCQEQRPHCLPCRAW